MRLAGEGASLSLLIRGEFGISNTILLSSIYGAAVLAIPLILNSIIAISTLGLGLSQYATAESILASIYSQVNSSYAYVEVVLIIGFIGASFLAGRSFARKSESLTKIIIHEGGNVAAVKQTLAFVLLIVSLCSTLLGFCLSTALASGALYMSSILLHAPDLLPGLDYLYAVYLIIVFVSGFGSLSVGALSTKLETLQAK